jgi:radical SAM superfamily enzyme YgiQ (UPF0313 family)
LDQVEKTFSLCNEIGIETVAFFVLGYPGETHDTIRQTLDFSRKLEPDFVTFNIFTPVPGSAVFGEFKHSGNWNDYDYNSLSFCAIERDELIKAKNKAYRSFYMRPSYIMRRMRKIGTRRTVSQNLKFWMMRKGTLWKAISS